MHPGSSDDVSLRKEPENQVFVIMRYEKNVDYIAFAARLGMRLDDRSQERLHRRNLGGRRASSALQRKPGRNTGLHLPVGKALQERRHQPADPDVSFADQLGARVPDAGIPADEDRAQLIDYAAGVFPFSPTGFLFMRMRVYFFLPSMKGSLCFSSG